MKKLIVLFIGCFFFFSCSNGILDDEVGRSETEVLDCSDDPAINNFNYRNCTGGSCLSRCYSQYYGDSGVQFPNDTFSNETGIPKNVKFKGTTTYGTTNIHETLKIIFSGASPWFWCNEDTGINGYELVIQAAVNSDNSRYLAYLECVSNCVYNLSIKDLGSLNNDSGSTSGSGGGNGESNCDCKNFPCDPGFCCIDGKCMPT